MLGCIVWLLVWAIVLVLVWWAFQAIIGAVGLAIPPPIMTLIQVLLVILLVVAFLSCLGFMDSGGLWRPPLRP